MKVRRLVVWSGLALLAACQSTPKVQSSSPESSRRDRASLMQEGPAPISPLDFEVVARHDYQEVPSRIIVFIGDGMGHAALTAASYAGGQPLAMLSMPHVGFATTHEHEFVTTDSAASATALATGHKTHFEGVSVRPGTTVAQEADAAHQLPTLFGAAEQAGIATGLVATSRITHATPAAFASHRAHRSQYEDIALDYLRYKPRVMLGAGTRFFEERSDGRDLFKVFEQEGYTVARTADEVRGAVDGEGGLLGLMHRSDMPMAATGERAMSLEEMVEVAIQVLDRESPQGYVLMVEGSQIDWAGHDLDGPGIVSETLDLDRAVAHALTYARGRSDTLVVATADHETGGLSVLDPGYANRYLSVLGGAEHAYRLSVPAGYDAESVEDPLPPTVTHIALPNTGRFGPVEMREPRLTTSFGFLSVGSRAYWDGKGRYSATHTAVMVPILAEGPAARRVVAARDNAELGATLRELALAAAHAEPTRVEPPPTQEIAPRNVILMVGDGLGLSTLTAGLYGRGELATLGMETRALLSTHALDRVVNDSAATATAIASGRRSRVGVVGMAPATAGGALQPVRSAMATAALGGKRVGLVTTTSLTHATPAAFYAHQSSRGEEERIADDFVSFGERLGRGHGVDLAIGGGAKFFGGERLERLRAQEYAVSRSWPPSFAAGQPDLVLLGEEGLPAASERSSRAELPTLAQMTGAALEELVSEDQGFLLVVEGGQIDWALHGLTRDESLLAEVYDFDEAVRVALEFASQDGQTLVIATSDHDHTLSVLDNHYGFHRGFCGVMRACGGEFDGISLPVVAGEIANSEGFAARELQGEFGAPMMQVQYDWIVQEAARRVQLGGPHSANMVPLFASGPKSGQLGRLRDQPQLGRWLQDWAAPVQVEMR
ncbi:alkaline phosphatase [Lujinxingia litoralis]|nr:alkaline phosphatase [Lujinxingia litoralis]